MNSSRGNTDDSVNWTSRRLLDWTAAHLERKGIDSPRLSAEMLLAHILHLPRINLFMDMDRPASPLERAAFRDLVERAVAHEPVQYLVGHAHFYGLQFAVNRGVLIPRPSTETLVEHIIRHTQNTPGFASPAHYHTGDLAVYVLEGAGAMSVDGTTRTGGAGDVIVEAAERIMVMRNESADDWLRFVVFQVGPTGAPMIVLTE